MNISSRRATVCFIRQSDKLLLALIEYSPEKKFWNGIGGWTEVGETAEDAVIREIEEETYIKIQKKDLKKVIEFEGGNYLHVFLTDIWSGELKTKDPSLKDLKWFPVNELPYSQMLPGNEEWLPKVLEGKLLKADDKGLKEVHSLS